MKAHKILENVAYCSLLALISSALVGLTAGVWMAIFTVFLR